MEHNELNVMTLISLHFSELEPHGLLFMENFTLQESMSVLEVKIHAAMPAQFLTRRVYNRLENPVWTVALSSRSSSSRLLILSRYSFLKKYVGFWIGRLHMRYVP